MNPLLDGADSVIIARLAARIDTVLQGCVIQNGIIALALVLGHAFAGEEAENVDLLLALIKRIVAETPVQEAVH